MDFLMSLAVLGGAALVYRKFAAPQTIDKRIFIGSMIELWKRNYPGYYDNVNSLPPEMRAEHYMRCELAFGDLVEAVAIAGQSKKIWPFRFKEWSKFVLGTGIPVEALASQCKAPAFVVRGCLVYNNLIEFDKRNDKIKYILKGEIPQDMLPKKHDMSQYTGQVGFEDWIFLKRKDGLLIPADSIITRG